MSKNILVGVLLVNEAVLQVPWHDPQVDCPVAAVEAEEEEGEEVSCSTVQVQLEQVQICLYPVLTGGPGPAPLHPLPALPGDQLRHLGVFLTILHLEQVSSA